MDPILGRLSDEILLAAACGTVASNGMSTGPHEIIELGELDDECIVVVLEERFRLQPGCKDRLEVPLRLFLGSVSCVAVRCVQSQI